MAARSRKERDRQWLALGACIRNFYALRDDREVCHRVVGEVLQQAEQLHTEQMISALGQVEAALSAGFAAVVTDEEIEAAGILASLLAYPIERGPWVNDDEWGVYLSARAEARAWLCDYARRHTGASR